MNTTLPRLGLAALAAAFCGLVSTSVLAQAPAGGAAAPAPATPRMGDKVDFSGIWGGGVAQLTPTTCQKSVNAFANDDDPRFTAGGAKGSQQWITFEQDCGIQHRGRSSKPAYKPQYWERVRLNDFYANAGGKFAEYADPQWKNLPIGVPRLGPPNQIVQTPDHVYFLYENQNTFRSIPTDCREHDPVLKYDQSFNGLSVGCWEGNDKLVIKSMGFTDKTWLDWPGFMHSAEMIVTETLTRQGDTLVFDVTVEDPVMFLQPWKSAFGTGRLQRNTNPKTELMQDVPYNDLSLGALFDPSYRG